MGDEGEQGRGQQQQQQQQQQHPTDPTRAKIVNLMVKNTFPSQFQLRFSLFINMLFQQMYDSIVKLIAILFSSSAPADDGASDERAIG